MAAVEFGDSATPSGAAKGVPDPHRKAGLMIRASREPDAPSADAMVHGDNNHGYSTDGRSIALSCGARGESRVHVVAAAGGQPRVLTEQTPSYWHGWSPDGRTLAFVGRRDGEFDIFTVPVEGGVERRFTNANGLDDGPDYTQDGQWIQARRTLISAGRTCCFRRGWRRECWHSRAPTMVEVEIDCPYCGEQVSLAIDETGGRAQTYVEDCAVCCKPIEVTARYDGEAFEVRTRTADD